jgi:hypothetical protein
MKNKKLPKYNVGGLIQGISPALNLLPGGQFIAPIANMIGGLINENSQVQKPVPVATKYTNNPYQAMRTGGQPNGFKQYNTESHENGGQPINSNGEVDYKNPTAEIETVENKYTYSKLPNKNGKTYIFSEQNGTAPLVSDIMKKYKNKNVDKDFLAKTAMELEISKIEKLNDNIKQAQEMAQQEQAPMQAEAEMAGGGGLNISTLRHERYHQSLQGVFDKALRGSQENLEQLPNGGNPGTPIQLGVELGTSEIPRLRTLQPQQLQGNYSVPTIPTISKMDTGQRLNNGLNINNLQLPNISNGDVSNVLGAGLTAFDVIRGINATPDEVDPRLTDYSKADEKMYGVNTDTTQIRNQAQNATNQAISQIDNGSSSQAQRQSRLSGVYGNFADTLANVALQEQQQRNQILTQQGQYESGKAQDIANKLAVRDEKFAMNKAASNQLRDVARQTVNSFAAEQANKQAVRDQTEHVFTQARLKTQDGFALLNKIAENFGITGSEEWTKYLSNPSPENLKAVENSIKLKVK